MMFEIFPNEIILHIFDYLIATDDIKYNLKNIYNVSLCCQLFHDIVFSHPIMCLVPQNTRVERQDAFRLMVIYNHRKILQKLQNIVDECINSLFTQVCENIWTYNSTTSEDLRALFDTYHGFTIRKIVHDDVFIEIAPVQNIDLYSWKLNFAITTIFKIHSRIKMVSHLYKNLAIQEPIPKVDELAKVPNIYRFMTRYEINLISKLIKCIKIYIDSRINEYRYL